MQAMLAGPVGLIIGPTLDDDSQACCGLLLVAAAECANLAARRSA
jgi:hypothetical protein